MLSALVLFAWYIVSGSGLCVRPIENHWMEDTAPSNISVSFFRLDDTLKLQDVYLSFEHSHCISPVPGSHRFVCDGRSIHVRCVAGDHWVFGLGARSMLWSRFSHFTIDQHRIILVGRDEETDEEMDTATDFVNCENSRGALCQFRSKGVRWRAGDGQMVESPLHVLLVSDGDSIELPPRLFADLQEHIKNGEHRKVQFTIRDVHGTELVCGENCLWSKRFMSSFIFHGKVGNSDNVLGLNQRILQDNRMGYDANQHRVRLKPFAHAISDPGWKLFVQSFLLFKIIVAVWTATHTDVHEGINWLRLTFGAVIVFEYLVTQWSIIPVAQLLLVALIGLGWVYTQDSLLFVILVLQTAYYELDSYECIILTATLQIILAAFLFLRVLVQCDSKPALAQGLFALAVLLYLLVLNSFTWMWIVFEELSCVLGSSRALVSATFYLLITVFVQEAFTLPHERSS